MEYTNRPTNNLIEVENIDVTLVEKGIDAIFLKYALFFRFPLIKLDFVYAFVN